MTTQKPYHIYYQETEKMVVMDWDGYATSSEFHAGTAFMFELVQNYKCSKVLADVKDMLMISQDDQKWLAEEFIPKLVRTGVDMVAMVCPQHYFGKVAAESLTQKANELNLDCRIFRDAAAARDWLIA
ncbi:hypothetical protein [Pedobacter sp. SYSU D00535]|uniref:hypothetical protein n=1 Tax=Pedobacter sp. SYSU D00535 TaxID=2810308 RepID=UPI001A95C54A|nr:hypothetical protein [Pedobacter sp. SYSU D00535]